MIPSSHIAAAGCYKKALMILCLSLALCASDGAWGSSVGDTPGRGSGISVQEAGTTDSVKKRPQGIVSTEENFERFDDFFVRLKDDRKKDRILVCVVVMQLNRGMRLPEERTQLRKIIYKTLKERSGLSEIRQGLREKIKVRLNAFMGDEIIGNIYFTKFVLL